LTLTNVQKSTSGFYSVLVNGPFGSVLSSNAGLTVDLLPVIIAQPQSQEGIVGSNVTFSVGADNGQISTVVSGTMQLWLRADAGVTTNASGLVSQWQDQSGNNNNAFQTNMNLQPALVSAADLNGLPAVQFNGIQDNILGSYLFGPSNVNVPNAMTAFTVYNALSDTNAQDLIWTIGIPDVHGANRAAMIVNGDRRPVLWWVWTPSPTAWNFSAQTAPRAILWVTDRLLWPTGFRWVATPRAWTRSQPSAGPAAR
jgi:hypothetical protein